VLLYNPSHALRWETWKNYLWRYLFKLRLLGNLRWNEQFLIVSDQLYHPCIMELIQLRTITINKMSPLILFQPFNLMDDHSFKQEQS
jgi:hypothetical protein